MKRLVTVVIATYNRATSLKKCLQSLSLQTTPKGLYSVLVVDDGSTDETKAVVSQFKGLNIRYLYQKHKGVGAARNIAVRKAQTDLIAFIDDDCVATKKWLDVMLSFRSRNRVAGAAGKVRIRNPKKLFERYADWSLFSCGGNPQLNGDDPPFIGTLNSIFKRKLLISVGNFDRTLLAGEDLDIGWRLSFQHYRFDFLPEALVFHIAPKNLWNHCRKSFIYGRAYAKVSNKHMRELANYKRLNHQHFKKNQQVPVVYRFLEFFARNSFNVGYKFQKINKWM